MVNAQASDTQSSMMISKQFTGDYKSDSDAEGLKRSKLARISKRYTMDPPLFKQSHNAMPLSMKTKRTLGSKIIPSKEIQSPLQQSLIGSGMQHALSSPQCSNMRVLKSTTDMQTFRIR